MPLIRFSRDEFDVLKNCRAFDAFDAIDTVSMRGIWCLEKLQSIWWPWWHPHGFHARNLVSGETEKDLMLSMQSTRFSWKESDAWRSCRAFDDLNDIYTVFTQGIRCLKKMHSIWWSQCNRHDFPVRKSVFRETAKHPMISMQLTSSSLIESEELIDFWVDRIRLNFYAWKCRVPSWVLLKISQKE